MGVAIKDKNILLELCRDINLNPYKYSTQAILDKLVSKWNEPLLFEVEEQS